MFQKKFFLNQQLFFLAKKNDPNFFFVHSVFYVLESKKKIQSDPKFIYFKIYLTFFEKSIFYVKKCPNLSKKKFH